MKVITEHPAVRKALDVYRAVFRDGRAFHALHQHFSFVCGAQGDVLPSGERSLRAEFRDFLKRHGVKYNLLAIFAEQAVEEFLRGETDTFLDLAKFEELVAHTVDSILIFPESPGSFAELGFFAAIEETRRKTLVATLVAHQDPSFINLGPLPLFNQKSIYQPIPVVLGQDLAAGFHQVCKRLTYQTEQRKYRKRFDYGEFEKLSAKDQLIALYEVIRAFGFITEKHLFASVRMMFERYDSDRVRRLLAVLVAMSFVKRTEYGDYVAANPAIGLLEYDGIAFDEVRASLLSYYQKNDAKAAQLAGGSL